MPRGCRIATPVLLTLLLAGSGRASAVPAHDFVVRSHIELEGCITDGRPPNDCRFEPLRLAENDERNLRDLITSARDREEREAREGAREGKVTGGVWGFVSYGPRLSFSSDGKKDSAWLHASKDAAWLEGGAHVGRVVFTAPESRRLLAILTRAVPGLAEGGKEPSPEARAELIVKRLPLAVAWQPSTKIDLNCDGASDDVYVGADRTHYYVAAVVTPVQDDSTATSVQFSLDGDRKAPSAASLKNYAKRVSTSTSPRLLEMSRKAGAGPHRVKACSW